MNINKNNAANLVRNIDRKQGTHTSHKNNCRAKQSRAYLSQSARAIFSGSCFRGYYNRISERSIA